MKVSNQYSFPDITKGVGVLVTENEVSIVGTSEDDALYLLRTAIGVITEKQEKNW